MKGATFFIAIKNLVNWINSFGDKGWQWVILVVSVILICAIVAIGPAAIAKFILKKDEDDCGLVYCVSGILLLGFSALIIWQNPEIQPSGGEKVKKFELSGKLPKKNNQPHVDEGSNLESIQESQNDNSNDEVELEWTECPLCNSTGKCGVCYGNRLCEGCHGSGSVYNSIDYSPGQYETCGACGGTGLCQMCEGSGNCSLCEGSGRPKF